MMNPVNVLPKTMRMRIVLGGIVCVLLAAAGVVAMWLNDDVGSIGSEFPPLSAEDFVAGRAAIDFEITGGDADQVVIAYSYTNQTSEPRSFEWPSLTARTSGGQEIACWGDDSATAYDAPSDERVEAYGGCELPPGDRYTFFYEGVEVGELVP